MEKTVAVQVRVVSRPQSLFVGERIVLGVEVENNCIDTPIRLINIDCFDSLIKVENDTLEQDLLLRPKEVYYCEIEIRALEAKSLQTSEFFVEYAEEGMRSSTASFRPGQFVFLPSPLREIKITFEPICSYNGVTKIGITLRHHGHSVFEDFTAFIEPKDAIIAAKTICRPTFSSSDPEEKAELVLRPGTVQLVLGSKFRDRQIEVRQEIVIPL